MSGPLLSVEQLAVRYGSKRAPVRAVDGVSLHIAPGESVGLVGESGCGKTTLGQAIMRLLPVQSGQISFQGENVAQWQGRQLKAYRQQVQMIFQDPYGSLNARMTVGRALMEALHVHRIGRRRERRDRAAALLTAVGLDPLYLNRYPHEFSGGQRQRIGIARALAVNPRLVIADEPVSALDVSIQAQVLNLFRELKDRLNLTYLFISHDLNVIRYISDRVAVMYLGKIVEIAVTEELFANPTHPYTRALLKAIPVPNPREKLELQALGGEVPSPINTPDGCPFHPRCEYAEEQCRMVPPELTQLDETHLAACHLAKGPV